MVCKWTGLRSSKAEVMALTWIMDNFNWTSGKNPCPIENYIVNMYQKIGKAFFHIISFSRRYYWC